MTKREVLFVILGMLLFCIFGSAGWDDYTDNLVVWYKFESNYNDLSGNNYDFSLEKTGEEMPKGSSDSSPSTSGSNSDGGSGAGGGNSITNINYNIYNITNIVKEVIKEITEKDELENVGEEAMFLEELERESSGFFGITGAVTATISNIKSNQSLIGSIVFMLIVTLLVVLGVHSRKRRKPPTVQLYYENKSEVHGNELEKREEKG